MQTALPIDPVSEYARAVTSGAIVAGPYVRAACKRHLDDLVAGAERGLRFDLNEVDNVVNFFRTALTIEVERRRDDGSVESTVVPFILQPWQEFIVGSLFGWLNADGLRRFRRAYIEIGKGAGKSPLAAGIGHYFLGGKGIAKERGEVYSAATSRDQAFILFRDAIAMWRRSRNLRRRITTKGKQTQTISQLTHIGTDSIFKPVSTENKGQSGLRPYCALIDEVHEHADNTVIEMMRAGTKGNQEALIFEITNSGFDKNTVCGQEHDYSIRVVNGDEKNDEWFAYVAALDEGDEPFENEACWIKANPNLGVSIHPAYIRGQVREAKGLPSKEGTVRRLNFCQWTESENCAIPRELWMKAEGEVDPEALTEAGYRCFGGLDLSRTTDLTAFTLTWIIDETKDQWKFVSKTWFWTPGATLAERSKRDRAPYEVWVDEGHLEAVPGKMIKFGWIADALLDLTSRFHPVMIGCDEYGLKQLVEKLEEMGQTLPCVVHPQGFQRRVVGDRPELEGTGAEEITLWMPDSINKCEAALLEERITVAVNPVMRMCSQGVVYASNRTGHRMFDKDRATSRIDGMVSLAMSVGVATVDSEEASSVFDLIADEEASGAAQSGAQSAQSGDDPVLARDEEAAILRDPAHPRWREVRDAFEARLALHDEEELA